MSVTGGVARWLAQLSCQDVLPDIFPQPGHLDELEVEYFLCRLQLHGGEGLYGLGDNNSADFCNSRTLVAFMRDVDPTTLVVAKDAAPLDEIAAAASMSRPIGCRPTCEKTRIRHRVMEMGSEPSGRVTGPVRGGGGGGGGVCMWHAPWQAKCACAQGL